MFPECLFVLIYGFVKRVVFFYHCLDCLGSLLCKQIIYLNSTEFEPYTVHKKHTKKNILAAFPPSGRTVLKTVRNGSITFPPEPGSAQHNYKPFTVWNSQGGWITVLKRAGRTHVVMSLSGLATCLLPDYQFLYSNDVNTS